jgi:hypothetical protein
MGRKVLLVIGGLAGLLGAAPVAASETITYTYDAKGRLTAVVHSGTVNASVQTTYTYDPADNRTNVTTSGATNGSGGGGDGGASVQPGYRTRYIYNGRFYVSISRQ